MSVDEVQSKYPGTKEPEGLGFGGSSMSVEPSKFPELKDVEYFELDFVDDRLVTITTFYTNQLEWTSDELSKRTAAVMGLDGTWNETVGGFLSMYCGEGFEDALLVNVGRRKPKRGLRSLPYVELKNLRESSEPERRRESFNNEADRKRGEQKNAFKP